MRWTSVPDAFWFLPLAPPSMTTSYVRCAMPTDVDGPELLVEVHVELLE